MPWETGREQALLEAQNIADAYAQVDRDATRERHGHPGQVPRRLSRSPSRILPSRSMTTSSGRSPDFRLNFFVDEVGQYIADNVKLMTNLQTMPRAWPPSAGAGPGSSSPPRRTWTRVVGEMGKQQGNDFSKIQARFANRMKLTSADVAEVIQKRLLAKNERGRAQLSDIYHAEQQQLQDPLRFRRWLADLPQLPGPGPFHPQLSVHAYQFALFQSAIQNLSQHNAFEGKHSSVGERSMLGVFQQVAMQIGDHEVGQLATFDLMFEGIRTALKSQIQRAILHGRRPSGRSPSPSSVLKALFLVKYVKEFKATVAQPHAC